MNDFSHQKFKSKKDVKKIGERLVLTLLYLIGYFYIVLLTSLEKWMG